MRSFASCLIGALALAGCFVTPGGGGPDPNRPLDLDPCPDGAPHLLLGLRSTSSIFDDHPSAQVLLRFTSDFVGCRGVAVPNQEFGEIQSVEGLPDGTDLVGFDGGRFSSVSSAVVRFRGTDEIDRVTDPMSFPVAIRAVTFGGAPAVAVLWGTQSSSSINNTRLDVVARDALSNVLGSWTVPRAMLDIAPALTDGDRITGLVEWDGLQGFRADPGAESLSTTGEPQVALPRAGRNYAMDVNGGNAQIATAEGVSFWTNGQSQAFVGPRYCRHPAILGGPLPLETATYVDVSIDVNDPAAAIVLVRGSLDVESTSTHLFRLQRRGECQRIYTVPDPYLAQAIAWSGR